MRGFSHNSIIFLSFLLISAYSIIPSYAQFVYQNHGISIVFPPDPIGPIVDPATGIVVFSFVCNSIDCSDWEIGSTDGTSMAIAFHPLGTPVDNLFYFGHLCTEGTYQPYLINGISTIKINTNCNMGITDLISEYYIFQTQNNLVVITYQAQDQFTYERHHQEFLSSINTLQIQS
jgi:hypothetical protein